MRLSINLLFVFAAALAIVALSMFMTPKANGIAAIEASFSADASFNVSASGSGVVYMTPDKVDIYLGVETTEKTAKDSQQENARIMAGVKGALKAIGISDDDMETTAYSLYPEYQYDYSGYGSKRTLIGYKTSHYIKVSSANTNKAGEIVDAASGGGANHIGSIAFGLKDVTMAQAKMDAMRLATVDAAEKARAIAEVFGSVKMSPMALSAGYDYQPYKYDYTRAEMALGSSDSAVPTEISAGDISVSASVSGYFRATPQ